MSDPVIGPTDLGTYLNDRGLDTARATLLISQAQALCESVVSPLPDQAAVVVTRVAGRAYVSITSTRQQQLQQAGSPFGAMPGGSGGVYLTEGDRRDLRRFGGAGGAFTIDILPSDYVLPVPAFGVDGTTDWDSPV